MHSDVSKCELVNKNGAVCAIAKKQGKLYKMIFKSSQNDRCKSTGASEMTTFEMATFVMATHS